MTQRVEGGLTYTQVFNAENRLISVTVSGQTTQFIYDGDGNLVKKIKPDGSKTLYPSTGLRAGVGGVYEVDKTSGGSVTRTVTYYPVANAMRINSTLYYILKDHLGSASVVTDASGNVVGENRYYPFGETRVATGTIYTDRLFTGQREITGLGIYDYGARFYSAKLGRFLSPDTIIPGAGNPQAFNRYSYVLNNPIRYNDPTGHSPAIVIPIALILFDLALVAAAATLTYVVLTNHDAMVEGISNAIYNGLSNEPKVLFSKNKNERKWIKWIIKGLGLDEDDREEVHQQMRRNRLNKKEIENEYKEIKRVKDKKKDEKKK